MAKEGISLLVHDNGRRLVRHEGQSINESTTIDTSSSIDQQQVNHSQRSSHDMLSRLQHLNFSDIVAARLPPTVAELVPANESSRVNINPFPATC